MCHFGDVHVSGQFVATDAIECLSPMILSDVDENQVDVDLVVSKTKSTFTANTLHFTYVPAPSLTRLSPHHLHTTEDA
jgi:hypothetical protein